MRVAEVDGAEAAEPTETELESINFEAMDTNDLFHSLEKTVVGYDDYQNCFEAHYNRTIDGLHILVTKIQRQSLFSANEAIDEI